MYVCVCVCVLNVCESLGYIGVCKCVCVCVCVLYSWVVLCLSLSFIVVFLFFPLMSSSFMRCFRPEHLQMLYVSKNSWTELAVGVPHIVNVLCERQSQASRRLAQRCSLKQPEDNRESNRAPL